MKSLTLNSLIKTKGDLLTGAITTLETDRDLDPLIESIGNARYVLLGEASHGTHEYYTMRAKISQRLIREKGFSFIAVEGDWPDCYRVNRYVKNYSESGKDAYTVLHAFKRWPTWMWANWEIVALSEWMKDFNKDLPRDQKAGFYGLDVYSLWESLEAITGYLKKHDPSTLKTALNAMNCFEPFRRDEGISYARRSSIVPELCEEEVVALLMEIRAKIPHYNSDYENVLSTEQNALIVVNAEKYYRSMVKGGEHSWNIRDIHMNETINRLMKFHGKNAKCIIWAHNTHIGDARATDMAEEGLVNIGQLVREDHKKDGVVTVGFGSYKGSVIAGREWSDVMRKLVLPEAREKSWEALLHETGKGKNLLLITNKIKNGSLKNPIDHRAVGVVYNPEIEKYGNYVPSIIPRRYDAFIYLDETRALNPLHIHPDGHQMPDTYPFGV